MRLGYVILPDELLEPFIALKWCTDRHSPLLTQNILADFIDSPLFGRHIKRMKKKYGKRRNTLIHALQKNLADKVTTQGTNAGIHLLCWLNGIPQSKEKALVKIAREKGLGIHSVTGLYQKPPKNIGLLLGYGNLPSRKITEGIEILAECLREL